MVGRVLLAAVVLLALAVGWVSYGPAGVVLVWLVARLVARGYALDG